MKFLEDLPPWVVYVFAAVVLALLMLRSSSASSSTGAGAMRSFQPTPADPNVLAEMAAESGDRLAAFQSITNVIGAEEISRIASDRDKFIAGITAETVDRRTDAALASEVYQSETSRLMGLAQTDADLHASLAATEAASSLGALDIASRERVSFGNFDVQKAGIAANEKTSLAEVNVNQYAAVTARKDQKNKNNNNLFSSIAKIGGKILSHFF